MEMILPKLTDANREEFTKTFIDPVVNPKCAHLLETRRFSIDEITKFFGGHIPQWMIDEGFVARLEK